MKKIFLIVSFLILFLTGCATQTEYVDRVVYRTPADKLIEPCGVFFIQGDTVKDALEQSAINLENLKLCNQDKASLRLWKDTYKD